MSKSHITAKRTSGSPCSIGEFLVTDSRDGYSWTAKVTRWKDGKVRPVRDFIMSTETGQQCLLKDMWDIIDAVNYVLRDEQNTKAIDEAANG